MYITLELAKKIDKRKPVWIAVKTINTPWTAEEEAMLAQAVKDHVSPSRLSVRLQRSEGAIKRRMRELGLTGTRRGPREVAKSPIRIRIDPIVQVTRWLEAGKSGDLVGFMECYGEEATLECACTGPAVYAGLGAIQEYWAPKLRSNSPRRFSLVGAGVEGECLIVDYMGYEAKQLRMFLTFDAAGRIVHSECKPLEYGPLDCDQTRSVTDVKRSAVG